MEIKYYIIFILIILSFGVNAQETNTWERPQGELENVELDVIGSKEIKLNNANRIYGPIPPQPVNRATPELSYSFRNFSYQSGDAGIRLRPRPVVAQPESKLYGNYFRVGFGNYITPLAEAYLTNKRNKDYSVGIHARYLNAFKGPVDGKNSGAGQLNTRLFGNMYGDKATVFGNLAFDRDNLHYYGYPKEDSLVNEEDIRQHFNQLKLETGMRNTNDEDDFQYDVRLGFSNIADHYAAHESDIYARVRTALDVTEDAIVHTNGSIDYISHKDTLDDGSKRLLVSVESFIEYQTQNFKLQAGAELAYSGDSLAGEDGLHFYPMAGISYLMGEGFRLYLKLDGGMKLMSMMSLAEENAYVPASIYQANGNMLQQLSTGLNGRIGSDLGFHLGVNWEKWKNAHFYNNLNADISKFEVLYDTGAVSILSPFASIEYNKSELYRVSLRGDYYAYTMSSLDEAWHRPDYRLAITGRINAGDKIFFTPELFVLGGIKARGLNDEIVHMKTVIDLNLGVEYVLNDRLSAFLSMKNMLGNHYMLFNHYPVRGFQALGGVTLKF